MATGKGNTTVFDGLWTHFSQLESPGFSREEGRCKEEREMDEITERMNGVKGGERNGQIKVHLWRRGK